MKKQLLIAAALLVPAGLASAHARWKVGSKITPPRTDATGLKTAPCGGVPRTTTFSQFKPGAQVTVEFEETIQHTSYFIVSFSQAGDAGFEQTVLAPNIVDDKSGAADLNHQYTATVTMPNMLCNDCTLQLIQVMKDGPMGLAGDETGRYYSCTDIQLVDNPQPRPDTPPVAQPDKAAPGAPLNLKIELKK
jgi:hypothetical protein